MSYTVEVAPNGAAVKRSTCAECGGAVTFEPFLCAWLHDAAELVVEHDGVGDEEMTAIESHLSAGERYLGGGGAACEWWIEVAETTKVVDHG